MGGTKAGILWANRGVYALLKCHHIRRNTRWKVSLYVYTLHVKSAAFVILCSLIFFFHGETELSDL